jgi:hypothetical protein
MEGKRVSSLDALGQGEKMPFVVPGCLKHGDHMPKPPGILPSTTLNPFPSLPLLFHPLSYAQLQVLFI